MSSRNLVICDPETEYAARLAAFLNGKRELAFQVKTCKSPDQIREAAGQMPVDILLIADECRELYDMQSEGEKADKTVLLTSEREEREDVDAYDLCRGKNWWAPGSSMCGMSPSATSWIWNIL